ncbi:hypothetical protein T4E_9334 [Trichinella pseudospiralis]|uniref:Uncharacterized protein n=1 Tax=Trichinella pseudospiralis TaxID=6337 RepID=A0A0V0XRC3_TRIPS|nr:hypothetical protein T4E_10155 [Trichinella pseudospiralis]KRX90599.1 hypothetical protein T4E_9334 [Trichinella pseudospiralis]
MFEVQLLYKTWVMGKLMRKLPWQCKISICSHDETLLMDVSNSSVIKSRSRMKSGRKCRPQFDFSAGITSPLYAMESDNMESVLPTKAR